MKLAFTTLGCPNWDLDTIISKAVEYGYQAVDFRGYLGELDIYKLPEFSTEVEKTIEKFQDSNLKVPCFSSSVTLFTFSYAELEKHLKELEQYSILCRKFNAPYIRVFGGEIGDVSRGEALDTVVSNLEIMLRIAEKYEVKLLIETHDDWTDCKYIADVFERVDSKHLQVVWDIHHPYRTVGEEPEQTWEVLGDRIKYTHWKDSYPTDQTAKGYQLCLMGEGDIPFRKIYDLLEEKGYDGYYTLEWEKVWWPDIEEPEIAFKQYVDYMSGIANN